MRRGLLALALALGLWGCGNGSEVEELKTYIKTIQQFADYNEQVENYIVRFDDPTASITEADVAAARKLLADYAAAVQVIEEPDESTLRNTHGLYARSFDEAQRVANAEADDLRDRAHNAAIGLRKLRSAVEGRFYPTMDVLMGRRDLTGDEWALAWPSDD